MCDAVNFQWIFIELCQSHSIGLEQNYGLSYWLTSSCRYVEWEERKKNWIERRLKTMEKKPNFILQTEFAIILCGKLCV